MTRDINSIEFSVFCLLTWAYHKLLFAVKCWNPTKEGLLSQRKMDSNDILSFFFFLYFQTHFILSLDQQKEKGSCWRLAISFLCKWIHSTRSKHLILWKSTLCVYSIHQTNILWKSRHALHTHVRANTAHTIHTRADSINKERNIPLVNVPFHQLDEYAESTFFCRAHIYVWTKTF